MFRKNIQYGIGDTKMKERNVKNEKVEIVGNGSKDNRPFSNYPLTIRKNTKSQANTVVPVIQKSKEKKERINVLIIEDYDLVKRGLKASLEEYPEINIIGAIGSDLNIEKIFSNNKIDVVIADLIMKLENGLEITRKIKQYSPKTNIIIITNCNTPDEVIIALGLGVRGYCSTEITVNSLVDVIKSVNHGSCWIDKYFSDVLLKFFPTPKSTKLSDNIRRNVLPLLTRREMEVLELVVEGKSNEEIAHELIVSPHTAKAHVSNILQKFEVSDRIQLAVKATKYHIV